MNKDQFIDLVARCKRNFPGKSERGLDNYHLSQIRGAASISGPISLQLKIAITLRLTRTLTLHTLSLLSGVPVEDLRILLCKPGIWRLIEKRLTESPEQAIKDVFRSAFQPLKNGVTKALKYEGIKPFAPMDNAYCRTILCCETIFPAITVYFDAYQEVNLPCKIEELFCVVACVLRTNLPNLFRLTLKNMLANKFLWKIIHGTISSVSSQQSIGGLKEALSVCTYTLSLSVQIMA